jgi:hypothetical protein
MDDGEYCILREETVRERRGSYSEFYCRLYPFICWIIIKEGPGNLSGGRSPHWVNHVNLCLSCIVCLMCFVSTFFLFYCSAVLVFLTAMSCRLVDPLCILHGYDQFKS